MNSPYENTPNGYTPYPGPEREPKKSGNGKLVALALCCSLLGGMVGATVMSLVGGYGTATVREGQREPVVIDVQKVDTSRALTQAEVYAQNVGSTVGIKTSVTTTNFWGFSTTQAASGSGFVYTDDGYILTNHHVIEGANSVTVSMYDGTTYDAQIVGYDESNDVAVLKIDAQGLTPVVLGNSDMVNVGDTVVAIGNPLGELTFSLTSGVVSALDRQVTFSGGISMDLMQTDCAINSGNSGGALFNLYGEVVGITNAKYSSSGTGSASIDNIGFAIPINTARSIADSIIEKGYVAKPYIGVSVLTVSDEVKSYGLPAGAAVQQITENSPAEKAGLKISDIITKVDALDITDSAQLVDYVGDCKVGDVITMTVYREGQYLTIRVTVGEKITAAIQDQPQQSQQSQQSGRYNGGSLFPWGW